MVDFELTDEQVAHYHEQGYLAIDALTSPEDIETLRQSYDRIFAERAGRDEGNSFDLAGADEDGKAAALPQILNPAKYAPEMNDSQLLQNATRVGRQLLGPDVKASFAHAIFKPPQHGAPTPWHQDAAYWDPNYDYKSISIWVPLQPATIENGCMHFVPHSHTLDVLTHHSINNDPRIHGLELDESEMHRTEAAVACPLPPGGATFHGGYMLHYAPANRSDIPRRALILNVSVPATPRKQRRSFPWMDEKRTARQQRAEQFKQSESASS